MSYQIVIYRTDKVKGFRRNGRHIKQRTIAGDVRLQVPSKVAQQFCQKYGYGDWQRTKPSPRPELEAASDVEIIEKYNAELRGIANYYALAKDVKNKLHKLEYLANYSLFKTLAGKYKTRKAIIIARLKQGNEYVHRYKVKEESKAVKVYKLKHLNRCPKRKTGDEIPNTLYLTAIGSELVRRLNQKGCEYCGRTGLPLQSHHVRRLKDLEQRSHVTKWEKLMIARRRKTLALCEECHSLLHQGKLSDVRYKSKS